MPCASTYLSAQPFSPRISTAFVNSPAAMYMSLNENKMVDKTRLGAFSTRQPS